MYNLKPLKRINTNARLSIKIEFKKVGLEMTLEFRDVCNVPNVCWQRVPNRWTRLFDSFRRDLKTFLSTSTFEALLLCAV